MKSHSERKKSQIQEQSNNVAKNLMDKKDKKLLSRQQQILNIVKHDSTDGYKKLNFLHTKTEIISPSENTYSLPCNYKIKILPKTKLVQKDISTPCSKLSKVNNSIQKFSVLPNEKFSWLDKNYLNSSYTKNVKYSKSIKIKYNQTNENRNTVSNEKPMTEKMEEVPSESRKPEDNILVEVDKIENDSKVVETEKPTSYKKVNQKEILRHKIQEAIKDGKIFLVRANIPYLDKIFQDKGWMKKHELPKTWHLAYGTFSNLDLSTSSLNDVYYSDETAFVYQELLHVSPNFIWDCRNDFVHWKGNIKSDTYLNRLERPLVYTSKIGLSIFLEQSYWFFEENVADVLFPRCYNISDEKDAFIDDYRNTAAQSFIKWFIDQVELNSDSLNNVFNHALSKPLNFAIERCEDIISVYRNDNLDTDLRQTSSKEWDWFIEIYIKFVHNEEMKNIGKLTNENDYKNSELMRMYDKAISIMDTIKYFDPQYDLNGMRNIWILKPNLSCCGYGIVMTHKLSNILDKVEESSRNYFVVQKYIEKPLLIKNTKFDVRHWFLVTQGYPLTIWIYKESLLRFSSRPFTFDNYHEIVHICNTAVQKKYSDQKDPVRTLNWDCEMLNSYLKESNPGYTGDPWYDIIYPKMCQAIIVTMLAAQNHIDSRERSFELYGADFVIMNDLSVWLIEINTNPRMHPPSSPVTERLYPEVLESLIKVILDYAVDDQADTGNFVLAYRQNNHLPSKAEKTYDLSLKGHKITKNEIILLESEMDQTKMDK